MKGTQEAHRRAAEQSRYAKQMDHYQSGKKKGRSNYYEPSSTVIHHNPSKFQQWLKRLFKK